MADEEHKLFSLKEAERTRREVEPLLLEAIECRRKVGDLDQSLGEIGNRIMLMGGMLVSYPEAAKLRVERDKLAETLRTALERIQSTGCVVKDLDMGLVDFPALVNEQEVYLCWRLGEDRIRFYHRQDEGFAGRRPLEPGDKGSGGAIQ